MKKRSLFVFTISITILLGLMIVPLRTPSVNIKPVSEYTLSDVTLSEPIKDEELTEPVDVTISGSSGEFSSEYFPMLNDDMGVLRLNWTHVANTSLAQSGYHPNPDFIFFTQTFEYSYNEIPRKMILDVECITKLSGDFIADRLFAGIGFWLIDPSGNWEEPLVHIPYTENQEWNISYDYGFTVLESTFDGTIEIDGLQEDPSDQITIAIGLTPTELFFRGEAGFENWRIYNGSMILDIDEIDVTIVRATPLDDPHMAEPVKSYRFPHEQGIDSFGEIISDDEFVYTGGAESGFLTKWSLDLKLIWMNELANSIAHDIALFNDSIFVGGVYIGEETTDLSISSWTTDGQLEWESIIDLDGYSEQFGDIAIDDEGFIYASIKRRHSEFPDDSLLLKLDNDGNLIWNRTLSKASSSSIHIIDANQILVLSRILKVFNSSGSVIREGPGIHMVTYHNGSIVGVKQVSIGIGRWSWTQLTLSRMNLNLTETWSYSMNISYNLGYHEKINTWNLEVTSEGAILLHLFLYNLANELRLYKFDADENLEWYKILGFSENWWGYPMASASNGLVYFTTVAFDGTRGLTGVDAFIYGDYTPSFNPQDPLLTISIIGIGGAALVAIIVILKRRR